VGASPVSLGAGGCLVKGGQVGPGTGPTGLGLLAGCRGLGEPPLGPGQLGGHLVRLALEVGGRAALGVLGQGLGQVPGALLRQGHGAAQALADGDQPVGGVAGLAGGRLLGGQHSLDALLVPLGRSVGRFQLGQPGRERLLLGLEGG